MPVGDDSGVNSVGVKGPYPPPPPPMGILYSPQFRSHQETKMAARQTQRSTSTNSRKNRGLDRYYPEMSMVTTLSHHTAVFDISWPKNFFFVNLSLLFMAN